MPFLFSFYLPLKGLDSPSTIICVYWRSGFGVIFSTNLVEYPNTNQPGQDPSRSSKYQQTGIFLPIYVP